MKIRNGFVSNSSSASFLIRFYSSLKEDEIKSYIDQDVKISINNNECEVYLSTGMFNDWRDVPEWKFVRAIYEDRIDNIDLVEIKQFSDEPHNEKHIPDFVVWDEDPYDQLILESNYVKYLMSIGVDLTNDDIKNILKS